MLSEMNQKKRSQIVKITKISLRNMSTDPLNILYVIGSRFPPYNLRSHSLPPYEVHFLYASLVMEVKRYRRWTFLHGRGLHSAEHVLVVLDYDEV